ncbi:hypothetical protein GCM10023324_41080 [Streptomyces youssoufiensis]
MAAASRRRRRRSSSATRGLATRGTGAGRGTRGGRLGASVGAPPRAWADASVGGGEADMAWNLRRDEGRSGTGGNRQPDRHRAGESRTQRLTRSRYE